MNKEVMQRLRYFMEEHTGDLLLCCALAAYVMGLLNLSLFDTHVFVISSYLGTSMLIAGFLLKLGVLTTERRLNSILKIALTFASAIVLTTAMLSFMINTGVFVKFVKQTTLGLPSNPTNVGWDYSAYWSTSAPEPLDNLAFQVIRPYAWLMQPMLILGAILLVIVVILSWTD